MSTIFEYSKLWPTCAGVWHLWSSKSFIHKFFLGENCDIPCRWCESGFLFILLNSQIRFSVNAVSWYVTNLDRTEIPRVYLFGMRRTMKASISLNDSYKANWTLKLRRNTINTIKERADIWIDTHWVGFKWLPESLVTDVNLHQYLLSGLN